MLRWVLILLNYACKLPTSFQLNLGWGQWGKWSKYWWNWCSGVRRDPNKENLDNISDNNQVKGCCCYDVTQSATGQSSKYFFVVSDIFRVTCELTPTAVTRILPLPSITWVPDNTIGSLVTPLLTCSQSQVSIYHLQPIRDQYLLFWCWSLVLGFRFILCNTG